ncbi:MAG TPA: plastocyanin/azurin family copper-binding protein [Ilumatobacteraceae bacterium]|nr:plastocyanin/azurin family copper-binding protein [Ilumatobacteraceae bacterium]
MKSGRGGRLAIAALVAATIIAACSSGDGPAADEQAAGSAPRSSVATTQAPTTTIDPVEARTIEQVNQYLTEAAAFDQAGADAQFPPGLEFSAGGAPGYTRYVFHEHSEGVVPTLVEGPLRGTVRCQDEALPCSYLELRELAASGDPIPPELQMTEEELTELVAQLDAVHAFADAHRDVATACAAGFVSDQIQTANMGSHFYQPQWLNDGFDPSRPEILLYALASGEVANGPLGQCIEGVWTGEPVKLVGVSFLVPPSIIGSDHPQTFAGPLDNWHIHYNLCRGRAQGRDTFVPRSECEASGGNFAPTLGWMIHAWVDPAHDNQLGVFAMWNSTIAPVSDGDTILENREVRGSDFPEGAEQSLITDFLYGGDLAVAVGQPLFFNNVDAVPHTVTAGTPADPALDDFDSGLLTPGSNFAVTFDEPGVYSLFCTLHPDMVANVTVD